MAAGVVPQSSCSLKPIAPPTSCSASPSGLAVLPLPEKAEIHRQAVGGLEHHPQMMRAGRAGRGAGARRRAGAAADERRQPAGQGVEGLLRADEVDVRVDSAGGEDQPFAGDGFGRHADDHARIDAFHDVGVAGLADAGDQAVLDADVGLVDAGVIDDQGVGDHAIEGVGLAHAGGLAHAVAEHLAAAEFALVAIDGEVVFDLQPQLRIAEADFVAGGRAVDFRVVRTLDFVGHWSYRG